jgi:hypothetical protein
VSIPDAVVDFIIRRSGFPPDGLFLYGRPHEKAFVANTTNDISLCQLKERLGAAVVMPDMGKRA